MNRFTYFVSGESHADISAWRYFQVCHRFSLAICQVRSSAFVNRDCFVWSWAWVWDWMLMCTACFCQCSISVPSNVNYQLNLETSCSQCSSCEANYTVYSHSSSTSYFCSWNWFQFHQAP